MTVGTAKRLPRAFREKHRPRTPAGLGLAASMAPSLRAASQAQDRSPAVLSPASGSRHESGRPPVMASPAGGRSCQQADEGGLARRHPRAPGELHHPRPRAGRVFAAFMAPAPRAASPAANGSPVIGSAASGRRHESGRPQVMASPAGGRSCRQADEGGRARRHPRAPGKVHCPHPPADQRCGMTR